MSLMSAATLGDGHEHRGRVLAEDSSDVRFRRRTSCRAVHLSVLSGGSPVTAQNVGQLPGRGLCNPKKLELPAQSGAAAAAHGPQPELEDRAPKGAVLGLGVARNLQANPWKPLGGPWRPWKSLGSCGRLLGAWTLGLAVSFA